MRAHAFGTFSLFDKITINEQCAVFFGLSKIKSPQKRPRSPGVANNNLNARVGASPALIKRQTKWNRFPTVWFER